ncbi:phosphoribosylaminoimidazole carboxylase [Piedraia hortae CBS 480.64]|uniref:Phosphoribosylaminoimidazole carboxylase n=1 Tax=Piedraia hortae CBS 480.64 TaxID=1314780 RepID=A0A6A7C5Z6_9PEZI|nr:phosphoribosylaminoimidazole carboxylase [Piedraia hortae CBS 480.64]
MDQKIACLGGGQLGRMLSFAASLLELPPIIFADVGTNTPAKQITCSSAGHIDGSFRDAAVIRALSRRCDILTVEIEHVDAKVLEELGEKVQPLGETVGIIQDKFLQKQFLRKRGVGVVECWEVGSRGSWEGGFPCMLKRRRGGYDGRGNYVARDKEGFEEGVRALGGEGLYVEKWAEFRMELAVMVVKTKEGVIAFPTVETVHEESILKVTYAPARGVGREVCKAARELAMKAVEGFKGKGVFGVEMFLLEDGTLLVNEIAPRPHNSGHYTIEGCMVSQFEAHLRAILDLPLKQEDLELREPSIMLNILGGEDKDSHKKVAAEATKHRRTKVHLYGKGEARKGRKMGHITVCAPTMAEAEAIVQPMLDFVNGTKTPIESKKTPTVAVVMGSDSDLPVLKPGLELLETFKIPYEVRVTSAHRTPRWMAEYATNAALRGTKCIIAAAGGAAHLPGMVAAHTPLPVIGVPVKPTIGDGTDSLLSICNMPKGVPVATVSVNNSINAALLAARILGISDAAIREHTEEYISESDRAVRAKDERLQAQGPWEY